jgi:hypothetical protein
MFRRTFVTVVILGVALGCDDGRDRQTLTPIPQAVADADRPIPEVLHKGIRFDSDYGCRTVARFEEFSRLVSARDETGLGYLVHEGHCVRLAKGTRFSLIDEAGSHVKLRVYGKQEPVEVWANRWTVYGPP